MASSSFFTGSRISRRKIHTPATYNSQRKLIFRTPSSTNSSWRSSSISSPAISTTAPDSTANAPSSPQLRPPGTTPPSSPRSSPFTSLSGSQPENLDDFVLPWETAAGSTTSLYKSSPPDLHYPADSRDERVNNRFLRQMDMYLFKNYQVRAVLTGERQHPFSDYPRLNEYWANLGYQDYNFSTDTTFDTLDAIRENGDIDFHHELQELLWFGDVLSYGNILRETYAIIYSIPLLMSKIYSTLKGSVRMMMALLFAMLLFAHFVVFASTIHKKLLHAYIAVLIPHN